MKYVIFTYEGQGLPIAQHLLEEGEQVLVTQIENLPGEKESSIDKKLRLKRYNNILKKISTEEIIGKLKKVKNPQDYFLFFESNKLFPYSQQLQHMGFHGNFPIEEDRLFEIDRDKAKEFVKKYYPNVKIAEKKTFKKIADAKEFLKKKPGNWVLKSQTDAVTTFIPATDDTFLSTKQILERLDIFKKYFENHGFFLEKKIMNVIEVTPEKFYYNGKPLCITINFENKFLGSGNIGEQVGCAGDLVFPISVESKINDVCFPPIVDELAKQHEGLFIWDASLLIDSKTDDIYFGEFCPNRPGYNCFYTEIEQKKSVSSFFSDIIREKNPLPLGTVGASVMFFNLNRDDKDELQHDVSIDIKDDNSAKHAWPYDIYRKVSNNNLQTIGYDKHLSPLTASGKSISEAVSKLYENAENFLLSGVYYRPKFDFLSKDYPTSILNRLDYCLKKNLFKLPFPL